MHDKIQESHLRRKAILYVRQSSLQQVVHNEESRRLQYAMEARLRELGWSAVEIIDQDLGRSAAGATERGGFERMVAEVCLGEVGVVAAREVSRFARNSREWQQLIEVCKMVGTLLVDHETIYDPRRGNDRLLLGVKGTLNEYELDVLRLRAWDARVEKARRGELRVQVPAGYVVIEEGEIVKDPDQRVQDALGLVFRKFAELGTVRQVLLWFLEERLDLPSYRHDGREWNVIWKRPRYSMILGFLRNPIYAGAYAYGKTGHDTVFIDGRSRRRSRRRPVDQWHALIYDHHASYVDRSEFERIQEMISKNNKGFLQAGGGAAKKGPGLLSSLLRCRRCGRKLAITYTGRARSVGRYVCLRGAQDNGEPRCINFGGDPLDQSIGREVLRVVEPGAIAAARGIEAEATGKHDDVKSALELSLREARFRADRAHRQYDAVDPENRLVADELERRWNVALNRVEELERRIQAIDAQTAAKAGVPRLEVGSLAEDLDRVWSDPNTDVRLKKRILRILIEEIVVDVDREAGNIVAIVHWKGGIHTELHVRVRRRGQNSLHTAPEIIGAIRTLALVSTDLEIAGCLNRNGLRTGHGNRWTTQLVRGARGHHGIAALASGEGATSEWLTLTEAGTYLDVAPRTVRHAIERGVIIAQHPLPDGPWILRRQDLDTVSVREAMNSVRRRDSKGAVHDDGEPNLFVLAPSPDEAV